MFGEAYRAGAPVTAWICLSIAEHTLRRGPLALYAQQSLSLQLIGDDQRDISRCPDRWAPAGYADYYLYFQDIRCSYSTPCFTV